ncbi:MAG: DUF1905 domain-containing protein [Gemmatimonadaceae bacterium]|nr:DUF1905 domain-containing protein [Gemmatimonadaceae bacterium]
MKFTATIEINGINPYVWVSASRAQRIKASWKKPMPVLVQVNGKPDVPWRINMMPAGDGGFYLYLAGEVRKASTTQVGDRVEVSVTFDGEYKGGPQHEMPPELATRLDGNTAAQAQWNALSPSRQKEILRYLAGLKSDEARQRNIERVMQVLGGAKERFMARDWN